MPPPPAPPTEAPVPPPYYPPQVEPEDLRIGEVHEVPVELIDPNPHQPRREFDPDALAELAASIREHGLLQPVLATRGAEGRYTLLAGERRWRASKEAGLDRVLARIIEASEVEQLELALIENVQRENLNPVEEARAYQELAQAFAYSQDQIARRVGKSRVAVANALRLLKMTESCLASLQAGEITAGHARAILMLPHPLQQDRLRVQIIEEALNVREAEKRAREILEGRGDYPKSNKISDKKDSSERKEDLDVVSLQEKLTLHLGCKVRVKPRSKKTGRLEIQYQSLDDLDRVLEIMGFTNEI